MIGIQQRLPSISPGRKAWIHSRKELLYGSPFRSIHDNDDDGDSDTESLEDHVGPQSPQYPNQPPRFLTPGQQELYRDKESKVCDQSLLEEVESDEKHLPEMDRATRVSASVDRAASEMTRCLAIFGASSMEDLVGSDHISVSQRSIMQNDDMASEGTPLSGGSLRDLYWGEDPTNSFLRLSGAESQDEEIVFSDTNSDETMSEDCNSSFRGEDDNRASEWDTLDRQEPSALLHHLRAMQTHARQYDDISIHTFNHGDDDDDNDSTIHMDGHSTDGEEEDEPSQNQSVESNKPFAVLSEPKTPHWVFEHSIHTEEMLTNEYQEDDDSQIDSDDDKSVQYPCHLSAKLNVDDFLSTNSFFEEKKDESSDAEFGQLSHFSVSSLSPKRPNFSEHEIQTAVEGLGSLIDQLRTELDNRKAATDDQLSLVLPDDASESQTECMDDSSSSASVSVTFTEGFTTSNAFDGATLSPSLRIVPSTPCSATLSTTFTPVTLPIGEWSYSEYETDSIEESKDNETICSFQTALTQQEEVDDICRKTDWMKKSLDALLDGNYSFGDSPETDEHGRVKLGSFLRHNENNQKLGPLTRKGSKRIGHGDFLEKDPKPNPPESNVTGFGESALTVNGLGLAEESKSAPMNVRILHWLAYVKVLLKLSTKRELHHFYLFACRLVPYEWWTAWIWWYNLYHQRCLPRKLQSTNLRLCIRYVTLFASLMAVYSAMIFLTHIRRIVSTLHAETSAEIPMSYPNPMLFGEFPDSYDQEIRL